VETIKYKLSQLNVYLKNIDSLDSGVLADWKYHDFTFYEITKFNLS
jgi:hypothetical protein